MTSARSWRRTVFLVGAIVMTTLLLAFNTSWRVSGEDETCSPDNLNTRNWSTDFCNSIVDFEEILVGNPVKDGIPSVTDPEMETVEEAADWLSERSPVILVELEDEARAYPLAILMWHEIANDEIAGVPVAVTFCPLCNSSITYDRRVDEDLLDFGVSGMLRNSDLVMFDRQSESWWQQLTGEALAGEYAGALLDIVPSQVVGFGSFSQRHPDGLVMSRDTGFGRNYGVNPYVDYDNRAGRPFLFRGEIDPRLGSAVDYVLAALIDDVAKAYPFAILRQDRVINDAVGDTPVVVFFQSGVASALGASEIDTAADLGTAGMYRSTLDGEALSFIANDDNTFSDQQTGSIWNGFGEAIGGELEGTQLEWVNAFPHFWFAWAAFQPETEVYGLE